MLSNFSIENYPVRLNVTEIEFRYRLVTLPLRDELEIEIVLVLFHRPNNTPCVIRSRRSQDMV